MPSLKIRRIDCDSPQASAQLKRLREQFNLDHGETLTAKEKKQSQAVFNKVLTPAQAAREICDTVSAKGLSAVAKYSKQFDGFNLTANNIRVTPEEMKEAYKAADKEFLDAVRAIRDNVLEFQSGILHTDAELRVHLRQEIHLRYKPRRRVGFYIPAGQAPLPSTLLMTVCPAQAAGVKEFVVMMPPAGADNPDMLAVCYMLGLHEHEVYRVGGAQAVAAMAYGLPEAKLDPVGMIVGPGNLYVTLAKQYVQNQVAIDCPAGPSEVIVVGDQTSPPHYLASDLLAQAEHSVTAKSLLVTWHEPLLDEVQTALEKQIDKLERSDTIRSSLEKNGAFVRVEDMDAAIELVNDLAPEHLHVQVREYEVFSDEIENAGAIFLDKWSPVALGDYAAGPSHVLPTGRSARYASGLTSNDFLKRLSVLAFTRNGLREIADEVMLMAHREGLTAHEASVRIRLDENPTQAPKPKKR